MSSANSSARWGGHPPTPIEGEGRLGRAALSDVHALMGVSSWTPVYVPSHAREAGAGRSTGKPGYAGVRLRIANRLGNSAQF